MLKQFNTEFYMRYAKASYDQQRYLDITASGAWDRSELTPLIIYSFHPRVKLYLEYYFTWINDPKGYTGNTNANYGFAELILFY